MRRVAGLILGVAAFAAVLAAPLPWEPAAHRLAAVFALVIVFWISEAIPLPVTALLGPALCVPLGVAGHREAFASFGHPIILLFLGSFVVARGMRAHGLDRRIALFVLSRSWVGERPGRIVVAFGAVGAFLSMWISNTATTAMMLPIGLGVLRSLPGRHGAEAPGGRFATGLMLAIAFSCNVGGIATPVGTPPNLIAMGMLERIAGRELSFVEWLGFGLPVSVALFGVVMLLLRLAFPPPVARFEGAAESIRAERRSLPPWGAGERVALGAFLTAVTLWLAPGVAALVLGRDHSLARVLGDALPESVAAICAAALLFLIPVPGRGGRPALEWRDAVRIDWGTILLFGGGLSLGSMAFTTGLAEHVGGGFLRALADWPVWAIALAALFLANVMTELMSNTATANLLIPTLLASVGPSADAALLPVLAATLGCSLAFCLPVATPPNAIVYGSGLVPLRRMIRAGVMLDIACGVVAWALLSMLVR